MLIQDKLYKDYRDVVNDLKGISPKLSTFKKLDDKRKAILDKIIEAEKENPTELTAKLCLGTKDESGVSGILRQKYWEGVDKLNPILKRAVELKNHIYVEPEIEIPENLKLLIDLADRICYEISLAIKQHKKK